MTVEYPLADMRGVALPSRPRLNPPLPGRWMGRQTFESANNKTDERMKGWIDGLMGSKFRWMVRKTKELLDGRVDERADGTMDEMMKRWMDGQKFARVWYA